MRYGVAFVLLVALLTISDCQRNTLSESEEHVAISQFFGYVDSINKIQNANAANIVGDFFRQIYNSIPEQDRGSSAAIIKSFLDDSDYAKSHGDMERLIQLVKGFQGTMEGLQANMMKQEAEDMIIMPSMFGFLMLVPQLSVQQERFLEKFNNAADILTAKFTDEGLGRHEQLFSFLTEFKNNVDVERVEELMEKLKEIKNQYV